MAPNTVNQSAIVYTMQVTFDIPDTYAAELANAGEDPARAALEALLVDSYRKQLINETQIKRILGFGTRMQVHSLLFEHGVPQNYTQEDARQDIATSEELYQMRLSKHA